MPTSIEPASLSGGEPAVDPMIGRMVGQYSVVRRIGQGGMGVVYETRHALLNQRAAIKVLHKDMSQDEKVLQRFFNEAKAISLAQHSSIVKIFDFGRLPDGIAYILMEFLEGETLLSRMEQASRDGKLLPLATVVELGRQVAAAIALIHEKGIVHRDLKPENIFVVPDSAATLGERVKLLDFGIAKFLDGAVRKTTVGMILGTPLYMSPEQCEGREDLDDKVDVYALGVILYELLAGRLPFTADTAAALMRQHMFKEPPSLAEAVLGLPEALVTLIHAMLVKSSTERPPMFEVAERLEALTVEASGQRIAPPLRPSGQVVIKARSATPREPGRAEPFDPFAATAAGPAAEVMARRSTPPASAAPDPFAATLGGPPGASSGRNSAVPAGSSSLSSGPAIRTSGDGLRPADSTPGLPVSSMPPQPRVTLASSSESSRARLPLVVVCVVSAAVMLAFTANAILHFNSPRDGTAERPVAVAAEAGKPVPTAAPAGQAGTAASKSALPVTGTTGVAVPATTGPAGRTESASREPATPANPPAEPGKKGRGKKSKRTEPDDKKPAAGKSVTRDSDIKDEVYR